MRRSTPTCISYRNSSGTAEDVSAAGVHNGGERCPETQKGSLLGSIPNLDFVELWTSAVNTSADNTQTSRRRVRMPCMS